MNATLKIKSNTEERVSKAKQGIEIGLRVLNSIAGRHQEYSVAIEAAKLETLSVLETGGVFGASRLVWDHIASFGKEIAEVQIAKAEVAILSVNGALPQRKVEALKLMDETKTAMERRDFRDADLKSGRVLQIIESIQRDSRVNAEYAETLRRTHWGKLEELKPRPRRRKA
ncbi:MAG: hypothetical protein WCW17_00585 [Patescibacteria group bacterium]